MMRETQEQEHFRPIQGARDDAFQSGSDDGGMATVEATTGFSGRQKLNSASALESGYRTAFVIENQGQQDVTGGCAACHAEQGARALPAVGQIFGPQSRNVLVQHIYAKNG